MTMASRTPSAAERKAAQESGARLAVAAKRKWKGVRLQVAAGDRGEVVELPTAAVKLLVRALEELGKGHAVTVLPVHARLTTQRAAELLGVSRPFLIKEIEAGKLRCDKVGTHRRIRYEELVAYQARVRGRQEEAMNALVEQAQELGMGY
jgi:excisionase family DNA binding protein